MSRVLLFSGGGDYTDPWHPFAETSEIVAGLLSSDGHEVTVVDSIDELESSLPAIDVLVVNAGGGTEPHPLDDRLDQVLARHGGAVLALHVAATLLPDHEGWERTIGGRWIRGVTTHPPAGRLRLRAASDSPLLTGIAPLHTVDEGYTGLRVADDVQVLLVHDHDGAAHPVCWLLERDGRRTAFDALGHDAAAYEAPGPRELVRRLVRWLSPRS